VADVTFTFQEDLLIGDYAAIVQLSGSKGDEPMGIDYRVRCPAPNWVVNNPSQYSGSMNMVARLNIFGKESNDPSDIIVARIDGQIRGVGKIQYFRQLDTDVLGSGWLAFITIFGNDTDDGKEIFLHVWDGDKCTEFAEVLEEFHYSDGNFLGSPVLPQSVNIINIVQKCIPLNKGWNWISINLDLGDNSVTNVLSSLKHKQNAIIKDNNKFSRYYVENNLGWQNTLQTIQPEKRYMLYLEQNDTLCIRGMPYASETRPITIVKGWNWIGVIPQIGNSVTQALKGLTPLNGDIIKDQSRFAQFVAGIGWVGNLNFLEAPKGYLLNISNPGLLIYQNSNNVIDGKVQQKRLEEAAEVPLNFAHSQYNSNMNIIARVTGIGIDPGDELRAYINGELKGKIASQYVSSFSEQLFFLTTYHDDPQQMTFKIYKADRKKELPLSGSVSYLSNGLAGLVEEPVELQLEASKKTALDLFLQDAVAIHPWDKTYDGVDVTLSHADSVTCTQYSFNSELPTGNQVAPITCTSITGQESNMTGVARVKYNERSNFVTLTDQIAFINPLTNDTVGCSQGTLVGSEILFSFVIVGGNGIDSIPIDVHYYSANLDSTFVIKAGVYYKKNKELGTIITPIEFNLSPVIITIGEGNIWTITLADTSWVGVYCVDFFAMTCDKNFADGQTTFCIRRSSTDDCLEVETRTGIEDKMVVRAQTISSDASVNGLMQVQYIAGQSVELKAGFEVMDMGSFQVRIIPCPSNN
jgi:hypothetical protein